MSREEAYHRTLDALAKMQWNVAMMLEAKATEAEKVRTWLCTHMTGESYGEHTEQLKASLTIHEQNVEVIDGLTKLCNGLSRNLKIILNPDEEHDEGGLSALMGLGSGDAD